MRTLGVARALAGCGLLVAANGVEPLWQTLNQAAQQAIQAKDYAALRKALVALQPLMPGNPRVAYNLAASDAVLGNTESALARLRNWSGMGLVADLQADEDFNSIRQTPGFTAILKQVESNRKPVKNAAVAFRLQEPDLLPEDIAYDAKAERFFISSVRKSKIVTGDGKQFATAPWAVLALAVDAKRRILWASTGWVPHCERCVPEDKDKTALLAFDLDSGALRKRIDSPWNGLLGDLTLSSGGDLYVSEGIHGAVLRLQAGSDELERLDAAGEFPSPQTPALSADEKTLYVPDYARGIAALHLANKRVEWLQPADNIALSGIDGLYFHNDFFVAVQNGTHPARIARFSRDLRKQTILEANTPKLGEPTHGTFVGAMFYFLANSGWSEYDENGKKTTKAPVISEVWKINVSRPE